MAWHLTLSIAFSACGFEPVQNFSIFNDCSEILALSSSLNHTLDIQSCRFIVSTQANGTITKEVDELDDFFCNMFPLMFATHWNAMNCI